jgi:hypothetical protein
MADTLEHLGPIEATQFRSTVATGTAPLSVVSTTVVPNLNAERVGGLQASDIARAAGAVQSLVPLLQGGWVATTEQIPGYWREGNTVHLRGSIKSGALGIAAVLPAGFRPSGTEYWSCACGAGFGRAAITPSGHVHILAGTNDMFSFSGIAFRVE